MGARSERDWDVLAGRLSAEAIGAGRPTAWFDQLYAAGEAGEVSMPWDRDEPHARLQEWTERAQVEGRGRRAVVVGCGLGADAEHVASLGFATTGFDVSATAVRLAGERRPGSRVDYVRADLLDLPPSWRHAFDLVVEIYTLQALPEPPRAEAAAAVAGLVAEGGTLLAVQLRETSEHRGDVGPPFAQPRALFDVFTRDGLRPVGLEELDGPLWRAELRR